MRKVMMATALAGAMLAVSVTGAAAWDDRHDGYRDGYRGPEPVLGLVGDAFRGVVKIATAPLALLAEIGRDGRRDHYYERAHYRDEGAYAVSPEMAHDYYGAGARYYGPPPRLYALDEH